MDDETCCKHILVIRTKIVEASGDLMLLGITIDIKLTFSKHIDNVCHNFQHKLHALRQIRKFRTTEKVKILVNLVVESQFNYALFVWML